MPNAGIQAWRSTNWKSADAGLNRAPQQQRLGEHQQRDDQRDLARPAARCCSSSRDEQQQQRAGDRQRDERGQDRKRHQSSLITLTTHASIFHYATGNTRGSAPPRGTATPRRRAPSRSAPPQHLARAADRRRPTPLTAPSITPDVDDLPQPFLRDDADRLDDRRVVDLVDVVLVQQQPVQRRRTARPRASAASRFFRKKYDRDADAADRDDDRHDHQRRASSVRSPPPPRRLGPAPLKLGSRNCSNRFDPPSACGSPT